MGYIGHARDGLQLYAIETKRESRVLQTDKRLCDGGLSSDIRLSDKSPQDHALGALFR